MNIDIREYEHRLGELAMAFRGTDDCRQREKIKQDYAATIDALIQTNNWEDMPAPEDMLPDDCMPPDFMRYWDNKYPARMWWPAGNP